MQLIFRTLWQSALFEPAEQLINAPLYQHTNSWNQTNLAISSSVSNDRECNLLRFCAGTWLVDATESVLKHGNYRSSSLKDRSTTSVCAGVHAIVGDFNGIFVWTVDDCEVFGDAEFDLCDVLRSGFLISKRIPEKK